MQLLRRSVRQPGLELNEPPIQPLGWSERGGTTVLVQGKTNMTSGR